MFLSIGMLKQKYFLTDIFILSAEKQPIKLSWRKIEWLRKQGYSANNIINLLGLLYYLPNILEMTGCFNSAYSAIIQEKWMLFAYFYYVQSSFIKLDSLFLGFLFLIVIAVKELFPVVFRFGASFFNVATFRTASFSFF